jgi:hypothetical protein
MPSEEESCCFAEASRSSCDVPVSMNGRHRRMPNAPVMTTTAPRTLSEYSSSRSGAIETLIDAGVGVGVPVPNGVHAILEHC